MMNEKTIDGKTVIELNGRIDSDNAAKTGEKLFAAAAGKDLVTIVIDAEKLNYISSAGLRVLLRFKNMHPDMKIINTRPEIYDIFVTTGFTEIMTIEKVYKTVSVEGCEEIGRGSNGTIYRIDQDNVVKVYNNADALEDIKHEREVARLALILGIPTAISYDVVRVKDSYGSVFELLNARSFTEILIKEPEKTDWCVREYVNMLRRIHSTVVPVGKLPDMKETVLSWAEYLSGHLPHDAGKKLVELVSAVPHDDHMIHGDYHTKNLELQNDEVLLIDMDTLSVGHPVFELASMFNAFIGFHELDHENVKRFQGFDFEFSTAFWHKALSLYLGTTDENRIKEVEDKARIIGYTRLIRRGLRRNESNTEKGRKEIKYRTGELLRLLEKTDTLLFCGGEIEVDAEKSNLSTVISFIESRLNETNCSAKELMQISLASEEIFVNISDYAYGSRKGKARVRVEVSGAPVTVTITFIDNGRPYDPLKLSDPDITLPAEKRKIGGLGVFLVKKTMDDVDYEYKEGQNILRLKKNI